MNSLHTWGGGDLFEKVFGAISLILYGDAEGGLGQVFRALLRVSLSVGAFCALLLAFFRQRFEPLIRSFLIPAIAIVFLLLVPRTTLTIIDHSCEKKERAALSVPFFLGKFAALTSTCVHEMRSLFEQALQKPYPWISRIYANNTPFSQKIAHNNPILAQNLDLFCRECVFRDYSAGRYTKQELLQSKNLLQFLQEKSSPQWGIPYFQKEKKEIFSCKAAFQSLAQEIETTAKNVGLSLEKPLIPQCEAKQETAWIEQKILIDALEGAIFSSPSQTSSWGASLCTALIGLQNGLLALLYFTFPLILLIALFSFGLRPLIYWTQGIVCVSLWPLFSLALSAVLDSLWLSHLGADHSDFTLALAPKLRASYALLEAAAALGMLAITGLTGLFVCGAVAKRCTTSVEEGSSPPCTESFSSPPSSVFAPPQGVEEGRQTFQGLSTKEQESFSGSSGFQEMLAATREEERADTLHRSIAAVEEAVKEGAKNAVRSMENWGEKQEAEKRKHENAASGASLPASWIQEAEGFCPMHRAELGSWSRPETPLPPQGEVP